ncbi:MAG: DUF177 domain-containing protein [Frankiales bacterium]|nr:DUF177 domain-containing protein [Frankiales bacterium]
MSTSHRATRLDPRAPLVLDTRELGRRAGSMRRVQRTVPAPDGWGLELVRVPAGTPVTLDFRLESVLDGVLVSGSVRAEVDAECGRCLEPVRTAVDVDIQELFAYDAGQQDDDVAAMEGDFIDIEPVVRDAVVLGLPLNPVCSEDCPGLCAGCGGSLRDLPDDHHHDEIDPRWAALAAIEPALDDNGGDTSVASPETAALAAVEPETGS